MLPHQFLQEWQNAAGNIAWIDAPAGLLNARSLESEQLHLLDCLVNGWGRDIHLVLILLSATVPQYVGQRLDRGLLFAEILAWADAELTRDLVGVHPFHEAQE